MQIAVVMPDPANRDDPIGWYTAAIDYNYRQDYASALRCYQKATELNPDFIDAWGKMGLLLVKLGRFEEARACDARVRELNQRIAGEVQRLSEAAEKNPSSVNAVLSTHSRKNIWAAGAASAICPGLGQVYTSGEYGKGWTILAALFISAVAGIFLDAFSGTYLLSPLAPYLAALPSLVILFPVLVWIYSIIHAIWTAYEVNRYCEVFVEVRTARLVMYIAITYFIGVLLFLYFPLVSTALSRFLAPGSIIR
jgi:tetratricopeptide (TPR) repeat protein